MDSNRKNNISLNKGLSFGSPQNMGSQKVDLATELTRAIKLHQASEFKRAKEIYEQIIKLHPWHFEALYLLGLLAYQTGNHSAALALTDKAISIKPDSAIFFNHRGLVLHALGEYQKALDSYDQALVLKSKYAEAHVNRGNSLEALRQDEQAIVSFELAIQLDPRLFNAYLLKANTLEKIGQSQAAVDVCDKVLDIRADFAQAHCARGISLTSLGHYAEAIEAFNTTLGFLPNFVPALCNRGVAFQRSYQYPLALADFNRSIFLEPGNSNLYFNIGSLFFQTGNILGALENYNKAIEITPNHVEANYNKSLLYLSQQDFDKGWDLLQWRFANPKHAQARLQTSLPTWLPSAPEHKRVLVWAEQGVGDQILFATLLKEAQQRIPELHVMLDARLVTLFERSLKGIRFHPHDKLINQAELDAHIPIMSLGAILRRSPRDFLNASYPLLLADPIRTAMLKRSLVSHGEVLCGIFWKSRHNKSALRKSLELMNLLPLLQIPGVKFVDLQYGDTDEERRLFLKKTGIEVINCDLVDNFKDLDGHAALIQACDFLVGCSNTSAHLAGALGKKTYLALAHGHGTFWYWANEVQGRSIWYPSIQTHRQTDPGNWAQPIEAICTEILVDFKNNLS